jgi:hypothetical protein
MAPRRLPEGLSSARRAAAAIALAAAALGCAVSYSRRTMVTVTSDPPGARILVDGRETGLTTPAQIAPGASARITVEKEGHAPSTRGVGSLTSVRFPRWLDGAVSDPSIAVPVFWVSSDLLRPIQIVRGVGARHVYFHLEPSAGP